MSLFRPIALLILVMAPRPLWCIAFTGSEISTMMNLMNEYRRRVANGSVPGQPAATNMVKLEWSLPLQTTAEQTLTPQSCPPPTPNPTVLAVNSVVECTFVVPASQPSYTQIEPVIGCINGWFADRSTFDPNLLPPANNNIRETGCIPTNSIQCIPYKQLVWAYTHTVGCSYTECPNANSPGQRDVFVRCVWNPIGGTVPATPPYEYAVNALPCSNCPASYPGCDSSLCVVPPGGLPTTTQSTTTVPPRCAISFEIDSSYQTANSLLNFQNALRSSSPNVQFVIVNTTITNPAPDNPNKLVVWFLVDNLCKDFSVTCASYEHGLNLPNKVNLEPCTTKSTSTGGVSTTAVLGGSGGGGSGTNVGFAVKFNWVVHLVMMFGWYAWFGLV